VDTTGLITELQSLPDEVLIEVLKAVFAVRQPNPEEARYNHNGFFLGTFSRIADDDEAEDGTLVWTAPWEIHAVAYIDHQRYATGGPDWGFCQFGTCQTCGIAVRSNGKEGHCPICATPVYMT
jgi:hypothetical protein